MCLRKCKKRYKTGGNGFGLGPARSRYWGIHFVPFQREFETFASNIFFSILAIARFLQRWNPRRAPSFPCCRPIPPIELLGPTPGVRDKFLLEQRFLIGRGSRSTRDHQPANSFNSLLPAVSVFLCFTRSSQDAIEFL